jgi:hypothetical protein
VQPSVAVSVLGATDRPARGAARNGHPVSPSDSHSNVASVLGSRRAHGTRIGNKTEKTVSD